MLDLILDCKKMKFLKNFLDWLDIQDIEASNLSETITKNRTIQRGRNFIKFNCVYMNTVTNQCIITTNFDRESAAPLSALATFTHMLIRFLFSTENQEKLYLYLIVSIGGGLVLLLMSLAMLNAQAGGLRQSKAEADELESRELSGVVPLAIPLLAGPGAISTTIIAAQKGGVAHLAAILACIAIVSVLTWAVLRAAHVIGARLGTTGLNVATRLLGLLLAALAIQTMAEGLKELFPGLA